MTKTDRAVPTKPPRNILQRQYMIHVTNIYSNQKSAIERYLPAIQWDCADLLLEWQRKILWDTVSMFICKCEKAHFKLAHQDWRFKDYHIDRILAFYELAVKRWDKSPSWMCAVFKRSFSEIEALLQLRRLGVRLDSDSILEYKKPFVAHFVQYFAVKRSGLTYEVWYLKKHKEYPSKIALDLWDVRSRQLELLINRCPDINVYGFDNKPELPEASFSESEEERPAELVGSSRFSRF